MTDTQLPSIISFSEDIATAERPKPLPAGDYVATIRNAEVKLSQKGTRYVAVAFFIPAEQYPADYTDGSPDGTTISYNRLSAEDNSGARYRMKLFVEAIKAKPGRELDIASWVNATAKVEVRHRTWEGNPVAEINRVSAD